MQNKLIFEDDGAKTVPTMCVLTERSAYNKPPPLVLSNVPRSPQVVAISPAATFEKRDAATTVTMLVPAVRRSLMWCGGVKLGDTRIFKFK